MRNPIIKLGLAFISLFTIPIVHAQGLNDFLACAEFSDRVERVLCLETALEDAVSQRQSSSESAPERAEQRRGIVESTAANQSRDDTSVRVEQEQRRFRLPRLGNIFGRGEAEESENEQEVSNTSGERVESFGRQTRVVTNDDGEDELIDEVIELEEVRSNMWLITLASGQVWRQTHARRYRLREGATVRIYPTGWGTNFRLETEGLGGFIQIERLR